MERQALYSSRRTAPPPGPVHAAQVSADGAAASEVGVRFRVARVARHPVTLWVGMVVLALWLPLNLLRDGAGGVPLTQATIDAAVLRTLEATQMAAQRGVRVYTVGVGTADSLRQVYEALGSRLTVETRETEVSALLALLGALLALASAGLSLWWFNRIA